MPVAKKKTGAAGGPATSSAPEMAALQKQFHKSMGESVGGLGYEPAQVARWPTAIPEFDLGTGGGFPRNKLSIIYGMESSAKTLDAMKAIIYAQMVWPDKKHALFDIEGTYDPIWFRKLGGDPAQLYVYRPDYAEQCGDMMEAMLEAPDCGILVVDSIAAFMTKLEVQKYHTEDELPGILARVMSKIVGRIIAAMIRAEKAGGWGSVIFINQTRIKIGVMYGDPEGYPGGNKQRFAACLVIRKYGTPTTKKDFPKQGDGAPFGRKCSAIIKKWKCPILSTHMDWVVWTRPFDGKDPGYTDSWHPVEAMLREAGLLTQTKQGWMYDEATLPTLKAWQEKFDELPQLRVGMVNAILAKADMEVSQGEEPDEDFDVTDPETGEVLPKKADAA